MKKIILVALLLGLVLVATPVLAQTSLAEQIASLQKQIVELQNKLAELLKQQKPVAWCGDFNRNLNVEDGSLDWINLKEVFRREGVLNAKEFQTKYGIPNTGFVGVLTRAKLNELYGCKKPPVNNQAPVISGISGPTSLKVGEMGTWTIKASDPMNGDMNYSVRWGDDTIPPSAPMLSGGWVAGYQQSATLTHVYRQAGIFTPHFTVINKSGKPAAEASLTVKVGPESQSPITVTAPNGGEKWTTYETEDLTWDWPNAKRTDKVDLYLSFAGFCGSDTVNSGICAQAHFSPYTLDKNISARAIYHWIVATDIDNKLIPAGNYRVRVCQAGTNVCDSSDNYFTILPASTAIPQ